MPESRQRITTLGYALLGLIGIEPQTGYKLGQTFRETPMDTFSASPGAIYPALKKLEAFGLVEKKPQRANDKTSSKTVLAMTEKGRNVMIEWLEREISHEDVKRDMGELLLRFAFIEHFTPMRRAQKFTANLRDAVSAHVRWLEDYYQDHQSTMTPLGRMALRNGIDVFAAHEKWAEGALMEIKALQHQGKNK